MAAHRKLRLEISLAAFFFIIISPSKKCVFLLFYVRRGDNYQEKYLGNAYLLEIFWRFQLRRAPSCLLSLLSPAEGYFSYSSLLSPIIKENKR